MVHQPDAKMPVWEFADRSSADASTTVALNFSYVGPKSPLEILNSPVQIKPDGFVLGRHSPRVPERSLILHLTETVISHYMRNRPWGWGQTYLFSLPS